MADAYDIAGLRESIENGRVQWRLHALQRMLERGISRSRVETALLNGEVIEVYADDQPYPRCLLLDGGNDPIHIVAALDSEARICHIITVYVPDLDHFEPGWRTRRKRT